MGLEISKCYSDCFHPMSAKLCKDISYHGVIQAVIFLGNRPNFAKFMARWNFNMGGNGKIPKGGISGKWLIVERNGWKVGNRGPRIYICRILLMPNCLSGLGFIRCILLNFRFYDLSNVTPSVFIRFHPNFIQSKISRGWYRLVWRCAKNYKSYGTSSFLNTGPYGTGTFKALFFPQF